MNVDEVKSVVKETINEMLKESMVKYSDKIVYDEINKRLNDYFKNNSEDQNLKVAVDKVRNDKYYPIIELYYRDYMNIEYISEHLGIDTSTVVRHKKRLCMEIFKNLQ